MLSRIYPSTGKGGTDMHFPRSERIGWRASLLGRTNRNASHPLNSLLNYA
jgi:hypothetical protein